MSNSIDIQLSPSFTTQQAIDIKVGNLGPQGPRGTNGLGIKSILLKEKVDNVSTYTITYDDDTTTEYNVLDGYTPIKGTDYFTSADISSIESTVENNIIEHIIGPIDSINGEVI